MLSLGVPHLTVRSDGLHSSIEKWVFSTWWSGSQIRAAGSEAALPVRALPSSPVGLAAERTGAGHLEISV